MSVQVAEKEDGGMPEEAECEAELLLRRADASDLLQERCRHRRLGTADRDHGLAEQDDAERNRLVGERVVVEDLDLVWDMDDEECCAVLAVEARAFVLVERVGEEVARDLRVRKDPLKFGGGRFGQVDPA